MWNEIIYPFPNFNGCTGEVSERINFIPHFFWVCDYLSILWLKLIHFCTRRPICFCWWMWFGDRNMILHLRFLGPSSGFHISHWDTQAETFKYHFTEIRLCLNQWWPSLLTHVGVNRPLCVNLRWYLPNMNVIFNLQLARKNWYYLLIN